MCNVKPIRTEGEYEVALARIAALEGAEPEGSEGDELDLLIDLVELYEYRNIPMPVAEGRALLNFWIYEKGWTAQGINDLLDERADIGELLAGRQDMTLEIATTLHRHLGIPVAELLRIASLEPQQGALLPVAGATFSGGTASGAQSV